MPSLAVDIRRAMEDVPGDRRGPVGVRHRQRTTAGRECAWMVPWGRIVGSAIGIGGCEVRALFEKPLEFRPCVALVPDLVGPSLKCADRGSGVFP